MTAAQQIESGALDPDERLERSARTRAADSGIWQHLSIGELPLGDVARLVGLASDNWATNVLLERVGGIAEVERAANLLDVHGVRLLDRVRDERGPDVPSTLSTGSAAGYADLFARVTSDGLDSPGVSSRVREWLRGGLDLSMVGSAFGLDPLSHGDDPGMQLISKTGTDVGIRADAGCVRVGRRTIVFACVANWERGADDARTRDEVLGLMRRIGDAIRAELS